MFRFAAAIWPLQTCCKPLFRGVRQKAEPYHGPHPDVAEDLVLWRRAKARELNVPPYFILHQKVLHAIADLKPSTREELTMVPGFGDKMFDKYGKDILEITTL